MVGSETLYRVVINYIEVGVISKYYDLNLA